MRKLLWALLIISVGCGPSDETSDRGDDDDGDDNLVNDGVTDEEKMAGDFDLIVDWNEARVKIEIYGGQGDEFWCGMAETGTSVDNGAWVEESCVDSLYCHDCGKLGVELALGGDPEDLNEGRETAFDDVSYEPGITYYVERKRTDASTPTECWYFGDNTNYYRVDLDTECETFVRVPDTE